MSDFNSNVTGGTVAYEDAVKINTGGDPQYWPTRRSKVELTFDVFEGEDGTQVLAHVGAVAKSKVAELLGSSAIAAGIHGTIVAPADAAPAGEPQRRTRGPNKTTASPPTSDASQAAAIEAAPQSSAGASPSPAGPQPTSGAGAEQTSGDAWDVDAGAAEVTDAELNAACSTTAERVANPALVRGVIQSFNTKAAGEKFTVTEIPQAQRAAFLQKLTDLKKA